MWPSRVYTVRNPRKKRPHRALTGQKTCTNHMMSVRALLRAVLPYAGAFAYLRALPIEEAPALKPLEYGLLAPAVGAVAFSLTFSWPSCLLPPPVTGHRTGSSSEPSLEDPRLYRLGRLPLYGSLAESPLASSSRDPIRYSTASRNLARFDAFEGYNHQHEVGKKERSTSYRVSPYERSRPQADAGREAVPPLG